MSERTEVRRPLGMDLFWTGDGVSDVATWSNNCVELQAGQRRKLYSILTAVYAQGLGEDMPLSQARVEGVISYDQVEEVFGELVSFFTVDVDHIRLLMYLPEQLLPDLRQEMTTDTEKEWARVCKEAWIRLLFEREPRANFVDGDILEPALGEPENVRKAGHLTPWMIGRKLVEVEEIVELMNVCGDEELVYSLLEGLIVARNNYLVDDIAWEKVLLVTSKYPSAKYLLTQSEVDTSSADYEFDLGTELQKIDEYLDSDSWYVRKVSAGRIAWERKMLTEKAYDIAADLQAERYFQDQEFDQVVELISHDPQLGIRVLTMLVGKLAQEDVERAKEMVWSYQSYLNGLWRAGGQEDQKVISQGLHHWLRWGIVSSEYIKQVGLQVRELDTPLNEAYIDESVVVGWSRHIAEKIESHPILSKYLYPTFVIVGSEAKGQALIGADVDGGIVFRPETNECDREMIMQLLFELPEMKKVERPVEFWISRDEKGYGLKCMPQEMRAAMRPYQIHFLINGIWVSNESEVFRVREDLLRKYLNLERFGETKDEVRRLMLRQLEYDAVQFRMLHKVFGQLYPQRKRDWTWYSDLIDGKSDYWNPEYRRIATLWFLSRVFLPRVGSDNYGNS